MVRSNLRLPLRSARSTTKLQIATAVACLCGVGFITFQPNMGGLSQSQLVNIQATTKETTSGPSIRLPPVQCSATRSPDLLSKDPNHGKNYTRWMDRTQFPFWMSFHSKEFDSIRWSAYENGQYYETVQESMWVDILKMAPAKSRILDVGGNIGYYSFISASVKQTFVVDAFEPNELNVLRFCESLTMNQWHNEQETSNGRARVNLHQYGMSNEPGRLQFFPDSNPGAGTFRKTSASRNNAQYLDISTLDQFADDRQWFDDRPSVPILKVDVEGLEANVLLGGRRLLQAKIVRNIFMEMASDPSTQTLQKSALQLLVDCGYTLKAYGGVEGPSIACRWDHDGTIVDTIYKYIEQQMKQRQLHVNLFWTVEL